MLTKNQAQQVVIGSIQKITNRSAIPPGGESLEALGIGHADATRSLAITIAADPEVGVPSLQHYIDPNLIADLNSAMTVDELSNRVFQLSAGKLCSNPNTPHPQE